MAGNHQTLKQKIHNWSRCHFGDEMCSVACRERGGERERGREGEGGLEAESDSAGTDWMEGGEVTRKSDGGQTKASG